MKYRPYKGVIKTRKSKERKLIEETLNFFYLVILLGSVYIWSKTKSTALGLTFFVLGVVFLSLAIVLIKKWRRQRLAESGIDMIDKMSGETFEEFLLAHFTCLGYKGQLTPLTEDFGADLVLEKDGRKIVVQAKRWQQVVGIESVQQVVGAIRHYSAHKGMVITNSSFTENAYELANSNGIELWDRTKLIELMIKNGKKITENIMSKQVLEEVAPGEVCPRCGSSLILKNGKRGKFWGCRSFPKCKYSKDFVG